MVDYNAGIPSPAHLAANVAYNQDACVSCQVRRKSCSSCFAVAGSAVVLVPDYSFPASRLVSLSLGLYVSHDMSLGVSSAT